MSVRKIFLLTCICIVTVQICIGAFFPQTWISALLWGPLMVIGSRDMWQNTHTILKNFPIVGHFRYILEMIRPEINQYFVESNSSGTPFSREQRSVVYQRAKGVLDTLPFGTQKDVYEVGYEWLTHSMTPVVWKEHNLRTTIGGKNCRQKYSASLFNISAMSYGALSKNAILALNGGAKMGGFYHNTGEGGLSPYHLEPGGDVVWQIGTGLFGCRGKDGKFSEELFQKKALIPHVKMVEIKISQGAKPGHGGILPAVKITSEIAEIRGVPLGKDVISPPGHSSFQGPFELLQFVQKLRTLSGGKPIGVKMCLGNRAEFIEWARAMVKTGITPDYVVVDGGEGGTGAAPLEFSNHVGHPLRDALHFVHSVLKGFGVRREIKVIASGKILTGHDFIRALILGADICNSARGMMLALGCIQALRCNTNHCPAGVATQDPDLVVGLHVPSKAQRVATYHKETMKSVTEILGAMGIESIQDLHPMYLLKRVDLTQVKSFAEIYPQVEDGILLKPETLWPTFIREHSGHEYHPRKLDRTG